MWDGGPDATYNCPLAANPAQTETDGDSVGDGCGVCAPGMTLMMPPAIIWMIVIKRRITGSSPTR